MVLSRTTTDAFAVHGGSMLSSCLMTETHKKHWNKKVNSSVFAVQTFRFKNLPGIYIYIDIEGMHGMSPEANLTGHAH